ncbi:dimethyladenosine transferase 1, mitochondrial [Eurytemora carolleeae]|uniref:dimethyladenosine transferase 1, mitochondrial n=1 Tax=Eurytemora carolleeae TaxID=1294199 RepID=UPI000C777406|nr:dimethyladenosine transferase 1, mitochondrial [Eurytemora carolleeae]|eukprot:XP_023326645.1 dimethyladenosine transferase 1, mitochondrial-like [Eurytemora affinis]
MSVSRIPPLPTVSDILRMYNIRAKKQLSQNFIMDPRLLRRIAEDWMAGLEQVGKVVPSSQRLDIHLGDVLSFNMQNIFPDGLRKDWLEEIPDIRVVGNLPFNVSTPLIIKWLRAMSTQSSIFSYGRVPLVLTFQHEVAHRMIAAPGDPERSRLSVVCQNWARVNYEFMIPAGAFVPAPEVQVGLVSFNPLTKPYIDLPFPLVNKVVSAVFSGKKKSISNTVKNLFPQKLEQDLGRQMLGLSRVSGSTKAINLGMDDLNRLCHAYKYLTEINPTLADYKRHVTPEATEEVLIGPPPLVGLQTA